MVSLMYLLILVLIKVALIVECSCSWVKIHLELKYNLVNKNGLTGRQVRKQWVFSQLNVK